MNYQRIFAVLAAGGAALVLSGCVVAPLEPYPVGVYPQATVSVHPAPIVVAPGPYYRGYHGYRGHRGHGDHRGHGGYRNHGHRNHR